MLLFLVLPLAALGARVSPTDRQLDQGAPADVSIFDLTAEHSVDASRFKTKGRNTPFQGWSLKGWAVLTVVGGEVKFEREA